MKTFLLAVALLLNISTQAATFGLVNKTRCDIVVNRLCYDSRCNIVSVTPFYVAAGASVSAPICRSGEFAVLEVQWADERCRDIPAVMVDGSPTAPAPCGIGSYTGTLRACEPCRDARVTFTPSTYQLIVE